MSYNWSREETKRGELATAIAIGAILLLGAVSLATSVLLNKERLKTKPRAEALSPVYFQPYLGPTNAFDYGRPYRYFLAEEDGKSLVCFQNLRPTTGELKQESNWNAWEIKSYGSSCSEGEKWDFLFGARQTTPALPPEYNKQWKTLCRVSQYDNFCKAQLQNAMNFAARATPTPTNTPTPTPPPTSTNTSESTRQAEKSQAAGGNEESSTSPQGTGQSGKSTSTAPSTSGEKSECEDKGGICVPTGVSCNELNGVDIIGSGRWQPDGNLSCGNENYLCCKRKESSGSNVSPSVSTPTSSPSSPNEPSHAKVSPVVSPTTRPTPTPTTSYLPDKDEVINKKGTIEVIVPFSLGSQNLYKYFEDIPIESWVDVSLKKTNNCGFFERILNGCYLFGREKKDQDGIHFIFENVDRYYYDSGLKKVSYHLTAERLPSEIYGREERTVEFKDFNSTYVEIRTENILINLSRHVKTFRVTFETIKDIRYEKKIFVYNLNNPTIFMVKLFSYKSNNGDSDTYIGSAIDTHEVDLESIAFPNGLLLVYISQNPSLLPDVINFTVEYACGTSEESYVKTAEVSLNPEQTLKVILTCNNDQN